MKQQLIGHSKAQVALVADVRPRLQVYVRVLVQSLCLRKLTSALVTFVRLIAGVVTHVCCVLRRQEKGLGTERARVRALVGVDALVSVEVVDARETFSADVASVRTFTGMSANVQVQIADLYQVTHATAHNARVRTGSSSESDRRPVWSNL